MDTNTVLAPKDGSFCNVCCGTVHFCLGLSLMLYHGGIYVYLCAYVCVCVCANVCVCVCVCVFFWMYVACACVVNYSVCLNKRKSSILPTNVLRFKSH